MLYLLLRLKRTDIDRQNGIIKVRRQVARVDSQIVVAPPKTKNSYHAVTISQQAIEVLKQQKKAVETMSDILHH